MNSTRGLLGAAVALAAALGCGSTTNSGGAGAVSVSVQPRAGTIGVGQTLQVTATVTGTTNKEVRWTVAETGGGSVSADGTYTAAATPGVYHVVATSTANPGSSDACEVTVTATPQVTVAISPRTPSVPVGATVHFSATVSGSSDTAVSWSVIEAGGGTISGAGAYVAPGTTGTYHVVATSHADPTRSDTATVTVTTIPPVVVTVSPRTPSVQVGASVQFSATVSGSSDTAVGWSVVEAGGGTISGAGAYVAPGTPGTYHVVATSHADPTRSDTATVTVTAPAGDLASQLQVLSSRAILFGHQSVGGQIMNVVADLLVPNTGPEPRIAWNARAASQLGAGIWGEFGVGANSYPAGKIDDFVSVLNGGAGAKVNIALMKFCFVDFYDSAPYWSSGSVQGLFDKYAAAMAALRASYPGLAIVHVTAPLVHVDLYPYAGNDRREAFNDLLRAAYSGREPLFDLARIESTKADGTTRCVDSGGVPALCPEYGKVNDDGHLNATAADLVARRLIAFLSALP